MEQTQAFNDQPAKEKIYKEREIWVGTFLGGVLAAGYMVAANYKAFGEVDKSKKTWLVTLAATAFLFYVSFFAPYIDRVPHTLFNLVCAGIIIVLAQIFQGEKIRSHVRSGGVIHGWWRTVGVSLAAAVITIGLVLGLTYLSVAVEEANTATKTYGALKHEIAYDRRNISEGEVDSLGGALRTAGFFDDEQQRFVHVRKAGTGYELSVSVLKSILKSPRELQWFDRLREDLQALFPNNKITINLVEDSLDKVVKRIE